MSTERLPDFQKLAAQLPAMIQQLHEKNLGKLAARNGHAPVPVACGICGRSHYGGAFKTKHKFCPRCRKLLKQGACAFVTISADKPRYFICALQDMPKDWAGTIRAVSEEEMDYLVKLDQPGSPPA